MSTSPAAADTIALNGFNNNNTAATVTFSP